MAYSAQRSVVRVQVCKTLIEAEAKGHSRMSMSCCISCCGGNDKGCQGSRKGASPASRHKDVLAGDIQAAPLKKPRQGLRDVPEVENLEQGQSASISTLPTYA